MWLFPPPPRYTLCDPAVAQYINDNFVVWGGDVTSADGYDTMGVCQVSSFPHTAIYVPSSSRNQYQKLWAHEGVCAVPSCVVAGIVTPPCSLAQPRTGPASSNELLTKVRAAMAAGAEHVGRIVAQRVAREEDRRLRLEQEQAYKESEERDRAKVPVCTPRSWTLVWADRGGFWWRPRSTLKRWKPSGRRSRKRRPCLWNWYADCALAPGTQVWCLTCPWPWLCARDWQAKEADIQRARNMLPPEPDHAGRDAPGGPTTTLRFTLPSGTRVQRRFKSTDTLEVRSFCCVARHVAVADVDSRAGVAWAQVVRQYVLVTLDDMAEIPDHIDPTSFELSTTFPKKTFTAKDEANQQSLQEADLVPQGVLFVAWGSA